MNDERGSANIATLSKIDGFAGHRPIPSISHPRAHM